MSIKDNQRGFGAIWAILVIITIALVVLVGLFVYRNHTSKTNSNSSKSVTTKPTAYLNVVNDDGSITQATPESITKTADQVSILASLRARCDNTQWSYITVNKNVFSDKDLYKQDGNYAKIDAHVCVAPSKSISDYEGSGARYYLHRTDANTWVVDDGSQLEISCSKVDGRGYPKTIISECYDDSKSITRAPQ